MRVVSVDDSAVAISSGHLATGMLVLGFGAIFRIRGVRARAVGRVRCSVPNRHFECEVEGMLWLGGEGRGNTTSKTAWEG